MKRLVFVLVLVSSVVGAQELKPVPKDSVRLFIPGCSKGYIFTASPRLVDQPGSSGLPEGTHLRMNGPKKMMSDIKAREGSMIEITGLVRRSDLVRDGVSVSPVRIRPGSASAGSLPSPGGSQMMIDVEGWRRVAGECSSR